MRMKTYNEERNILNYCPSIYLSKPSKSPVETILIFDCFVSFLSLDQTGQSNLSASAKKSISFVSGQTLIALERKCLYCSVSTNCTTLFINFRMNENCASERENDSKISCLYLFISCSANLGEQSSSDDEVANSLAVDLSLKKEIRILVSATSNIYTNPCFLSSSNRFFLNFLPSTTSFLSLRCFAPFMVSSANLSNSLRFVSNAISSPIFFSSSLSPSSDLGIFPATIEDMAIFASTTSRIYFVSLSLFMYDLYIPSFILRPISSASFSVNFDFATMDLNSLYSAIFSDMAF